jgi:hypothetical protein
MQIPMTTSGTWQGSEFVRSDVNLKHWVQALSSWRVKLSAVRQSKIIKYGELGCTATQWVDFSWGSSASTETTHLIVCHDNHYNTLCSTMNWNVLKSGTGITALTVSSILTFQCLSKSDHRLSQKQHDDMLSLWAYLLTIWHMINIRILVILLDITNFWRNFQVEILSV